MAFIAIIDIWNGYRAVADIEDGKILEFDSVAEVREFKAGKFGLGWQWLERYRDYKWLVINTESSAVEQV